MQSSVSTSEELTKHYTTAIDALCEIASACCALGRVGDARHLLGTSLQLIEASEVEPRDRLKLLLLYSKILIVDQLLTFRDADLLFSTIVQAKQIAEAAHNQQGIADALSLLGQAHYFATVFSSSTLDSPQGKYEEALAYQQQALSLREALHDTRGVSESHFFIGNVYERWQQNDLAQQHYTKPKGSPSSMVTSMKGPNPLVILLASLCTEETWIRRSPTPCKHCPCAKKPDFSPSCP